MTWEIELSRGSAADFHRRELPEVPRPALWLFEVQRPAIVLGSGQPASDLDEAACTAAGVQIVRRRSGGGAVLLDPGDVVWADVILPTDHHLADPDVGRAAWWVGEMWAAALAELGVGALSVHRRAMVVTPWSRTVCFAGIGPGEVLVDGAKAVGISQRRTRRAVRFQCAALLAWRPERLIGLLARPAPRVEDLGALHPLGTTVADVTEVLVRTLNTFA